MRYEPFQIEAAVRSICPEIARRVSIAGAARGEKTLWWELSACILSSQVPYALAAAAADAVDSAKVLHRPPPRGGSAPRLQALLEAPLHVDGRIRKYRFPAARAAQLALTHARVYGESESLEQLVGGFASANDGRDWLVANAPGLGPKQASMFLRNIGASYDLAVLDRHVLEYMAITGLRDSPGSIALTLAGYREAERTLRSHAAATCQVGIMDWAIWIVMRLARGERKALS